MNIDYRLIGSRIKAKRKLIGFTQEKLAEKLDVTVGYVSQLERGVTKISLDLLANISVILECNIADLITESAIASPDYRESEITEKFNHLSPRDKNLVMNFIDLLSER